MELNDFILRLRALIEEINSPEPTTINDNTGEPVDVVVVDPVTDGNTLHPPVANLTEVVVVDTETDTSELVPGTRNDSSELVEKSVTKAVADAEEHKQETVVEDETDSISKDAPLALSNIPQEFATFIEQLAEMNTRISLMEQNYNTLMTQFNIVGKAVENVTSTGQPKDYKEELARYTSQI